MTQKMEENTSAAPAKEPTGYNWHRGAVWCATALALAAWLILLFADGSNGSAGYWSLGLGVAACVAGFAGLPHNTAAYKRLATTAIIAALVLVVVLCAFITVIKIGLG